MSIDTQRAFRHEPLQPNMMRLLRLKPRACSTRIECEILHCNIKNDCNYIGLSYAWGPTGENKWINVNGLPCSITSHLAAALQQLQNQDEDCLLWIDQLCINQADDDEKSDQVNRMKDIYERADYVVVWLGTSHDDSDLLLMFFAILAQQEGSLNRIPTVAMLELVVQRMKDLLGRTDPILPWDEGRGPARSSSAFHDFCDRDYWKRVWVIQEFALAKETMICCGRVYIHFQTLLAAWDLIRNTQALVRFEKNSIGQVVKCAFTSPAMSYVSGILTRRKRYHLYQWRDPLARVMECNLCLQYDYNQVQASDVRDRVFALMGLCSDADEFQMFPDYASSAESVYENLARRFLEQGHIDNLCFCQSPRNPSWNALPTWAPDWSMQMRSSIMVYKTGFCASLTRTQSRPITTSDPKVVRLEGSVVGVISEVGKRWDSNWLDDVDPDAALQYLKDIWRFRSLSPRLREGSTLFDCARLAIANLNNWKDDEFPHWLGNDWPNTLASLTRDEDLETEFYNLRHASRYVAELKVLLPRLPFITESGWVGIAPSHARSGDKVVIFMGGNAPFIIRDSGASTYTVVGEAYVQGLMYGEFMTDDIQLEDFSLI